MPALRPPPTTPQPSPLKDRITELRASIDAHIDALAADEAKRCPGVPQQVLRNLITARGGQCQCRQYLIHTGEIK
jgi:hypothetical protein